MRIRRRVRHRRMQRAVVSYGAADSDNGTKAFISLGLTTSGSTSSSIDSPLAQSHEDAAHPPTAELVGNAVALALNQSPQKEETCSLARSVFCKKFSCRRVYGHYFFKSKSLVVVLILNALFSTALYGVTSEILKIIVGEEYVLARNLVLHGISQIMFPIAGHIADTYTGKHNVIRTSLWTAFVGFAVLGVSFSLDSYNDSISMLNKFITLPLSFLLLSVAYVCFTPTIILFGMDQLQGASHVHYRSFFYWWYWTLNVGVVFVNVPQFCRSEAEMGVIIQAEIGILCVSVALILDALLKEWLVIEPRSTQKNPLSQIVKILVHLTKDPSTQRVPSAVRHELERSGFGRLHLAKKRYGGKYETEEVEDVITFFRILLVLISVGCPVLSYAGVFGSVGLLASHMRGSLASIEFQSSICKVGFTITNAISAILLLTMIPLLDLLIVPVLRSSFPSILRRLGFGASLATLSLVSLFLMEGIGMHSSGDQVCMFNTGTGEDVRGQLEMDVYWILLPLTLVTLAEIFIYIPCFEFICAQSPANMRGLLIGLFFSVQGTFSLLAVLLEYLFSWSKVYTYPFVGKTGFTCGFWYYLILVCLSIVGLLAYILTACRYKKRQRDDKFITSVALVEECFRPGAVNGLVGMYYDNQMGFTGTESSAMLYR